jgi:hypothetical protein
MAGAVCVFIRGYGRGIVRAVVWKFGFIGGEGMDTVEKLKTRHHSLIVARDRCADHPPSEHRDFFLIVLGEMIEGVRAEIQAEEAKRIERAA